MLVVHLARGEDGTQHHRSLAEARRLQRTTFEQSCLTVAGTREYVGMEHELAEHPPGRGEQVRHRRQVHEDPVAASGFDEALAVGFGDVGPAVHHPGEQVVRPRAGPECVAGAHGGRDQVLDARHRRALGLLARRRHRGHGLRVHERVGAVEIVERSDEPVEPVVVVRRRLAGPGG